MLIKWLTSLLLPHLSSSLTDSLPSLNLLCHSKTDAWLMQDHRKAVWSIPYVSAAFFPILKQNFIAYRSSSRPDCNFEIHHLWQSGFSWVYSNCCYSRSFEAQIIKIGQSSHKMYSNNIVNFQESTTISNACTKKSKNLLKAPRMIFILFYGISTLVCCLMPNPLNTYILNIYNLVWFYGISTIVAYLMPNPLYTYILNICDLVRLVFMAYQSLLVI